MNPPGCWRAGTKVFLVLFLQKKNISSFSEEKEAKRLLSPGSFTYVAGLLLGALLIGHARAAEVVVIVKNVRNAQGDVRVAICKRADFLHPHCLWHERVQAAPGTVELHFPNVPPGTYAAEAFHDENRNGIKNAVILQVQNGKVVFKDSVKP